MIDSPMGAATFNDAWLLGGPTQSMTGNGLIIGARSNAVSDKGTERLVLS
jgi:hypothetical protein